MSGIVDLHVSEYLPDGSIAEHRHDQAWFCLVVDGSYEESILGMRNVHEPGDLLFCPAHASHAQRFGGDGARKVIFRCDASVAQWLGEHRTRLDGRPLVRRSHALRGMGRHIVSALAVDDAHSGVIADAVALDVLAETGREVAHLSLMEPGWLRRVRERLHDDPARMVSLAELAAVAGRHPVHVARGFRLFHHCTPGDYQRRLRMDRAARLLSNTTRPLLDIALECGFGGAAQFSRSFRAVHGTTPSAWRSSR
ncbi:MULTISPECIES: AraC family transcriptional regulator [Dyella]|uniref:AraC family transcriptional regulator n=2 Tax=Dyella TaxID=231454 RepID=A0A4R0YYL1_9GAMM|nr:MULTISPECIES: helix-turn-helix domain-containing protein [Dyella]TBR40542.1 AraC family transcriptional regulator [Dyella terrae]TCI11876.1 AraC family transcriptional regulator [Dyella soli]